MTVKEYQDDPIHENLRNFENELRKVFPRLRRTSGYRPNAKTKSGNLSRHGKGEAIDLGYDEEVGNYLWNTQEGISLLNKYNLGYLDESDPETMARTGATGKHFHIGFDSTLVPKTKQRYTELMSLPKSEQTYPTSVNTDTITFTNPEFKINTQGFTNNSGEVSSLLSLGLNPTFTEDSEQEDSQDKETQALQNKANEYKFIQELINKASVQYVDPDEYEFQQGGIIKDPQGQWAYPGQVTQIPSGDITMKGVPYPVLGIDNLGNVQIMQPNQDYKFKGDTVTEYPLISKNNNTKNGQ